MNNWPKLNDESLTANWGRLPYGNAWVAAHIEERRRNRVTAYQRSIAPNPPYIMARLQDIAPGDVIGSGIKGGYTAKTVWHISAPYTTGIPGDPFVWRVVVFTDGSTDELGTITLVEVRGGPKWEQRGNPAVVQHNIHNNTFVWIGED